MDKNENLQIKKPPYIKPQITEVELVAEEAVLAVCKDGAANIFLCAPAPTCVSTPAS